MIDQATVDKIIDSANILEVVSDFVTLRKRGVILRVSRQRTVQMFRLRQRGQCRTFHHGT